VAVKSILLDANSYAAFKQGVPEAVAILQHAPSIGINSVDLGELLGGFAAGSREAWNRAQLQQFLSSERVRVLSIDPTTAESYAQLYLHVRKHGKMIPTNDLWIAATARQHSLTLFSYDGHFDSVRDLLPVATRLDDLLV
jgi:tRNA(fMet)-specific endonuclease VapC